MVNTEVHRQKYKNIERDPRVTLTIRDEENPYRYAEVRGEVVEVVTGQEAREHIDQLSQKYHGQDYDPEDIKTERVTLWIVPNSSQTGRPSPAPESKKVDLLPGNEHIHYKLSRKRTSY